MHNFQDSIKGWIVGHKQQLVHYFERHHGLLEHSNEEGLNSNRRKRTSNIKALDKWSGHMKEVIWTQGVYIVDI